MASNFAVLGVAEVICRGISMVVTLTLAQRLGASGYGRVEFAFNVVFWLVLIVRDCFETIVTREIARHPQLTRALVAHVLAVKLSFALSLFVLLLGIGFTSYANRVDLAILGLYGLLLISTALGIDFVYRGTERMGLVAVSLCLRTLVYCFGVTFTVRDLSSILLVPVWLAAGEFCGIALVWLCFTKQFGVVRPVFNLRFLRVFLERGRSVVLVQLSQAVLISADFIIVGFRSPWSDLGRYGAPHRMVAALMAFGLIFQQVVFPTLSRSLRLPDESGRAFLDKAVRILMLGFVPVTVGGTVLADSLVRFLLPAEYHSSGFLLALGIWRAPLLSLSFLYQSALISMNRESAGLRLLVGGAIASGPCIAIFVRLFGQPGACVAANLIGLTLVVAGHYCLGRERRAPAAHHHLWKPLVAAAVMVPCCLWLEKTHVTVAILGGAIVYLAALWALGVREDLGMSRAG